ncbi:PfkB family carbohydrate kinase [Klebsiella sp. 2680]|uniref:PfkB family carbohydrate kinase n=1 Tax=Klebsiella sp. 2680 TaxID=2018037 RepID=UPI0011591DAB|nr:PfkB family carbohydrate kinase [Klebsiella sp. 2680]
MHIYVVGNITVDEIWRCALLPQKGESLHGEKTAQDIGGKGANQAIVLSRCGLPVTLIAGSGNDYYGQWIHNTLRQESLLFYPQHAISTHSDTSIIFTTEDDDNAIMTTTAAAEALTLDIIEPLLANACPGDILLQQGNFSAAKTGSLFALARRKQMVTVFNPSPVHPAFAALWPLVDIAVLNEHEARLLHPDPATTLIVETRGALGARLYHHQGIIDVAAEPTTVVDTTGAGDTFLAVMLASALRRETRPDELALRHASRAAALTISRSGTLQAFPDANILASLLQNNA